MTTPGGRSFKDGGVDHVLQDILTRLGKLERANRLTGASIGSGGLTVKDGGAINVEDSLGVVQVVLDSLGLNVGSGLVVVDEDGVDIDSGLVVMDSNGININAGGVILDNTGLRVSGGYVTAIDVEIDDDFTTNQTLTTTQAEKVSVDVPVASWATSALVLMYSSVQCAVGTNGPLGIICSARVDAVDEGSNQQDAAASTTSTSSMFKAKLLASPGATVELATYAARNGGSGNPATALCRVSGAVISIR